MKNRPYHLLHQKVRVLSVNSSPVASHLVCRRHREAWIYFISDSWGYLPLPKSLDEGEAHEVFAQGDGAVAHSRLVRCALCSLHGVAEALDAYFATDVYQLRQLPRELLELVLRG